LDSIDALHNVMGSVGATLSLTVVRGTEQRTVVVELTPPAE
jgi:hypothetical protein